MSSNEAWVVVVPSMRQTEAHTAELIGEAKRLVGGGPVQAIVVGHEVAEEAVPLGRWGISSALILEHAGLVQYQPELFARAIAESIGAATPIAVLFPGTVLGSDLGARVGEELNARFHAGCINFELSGTGIKLTRARAHGRSHQVEMAQGSPFLLSLVPDTVGPGAPGTSAGVPMKTVTVTVDPSGTALRASRFIPADPHTIDIRDADVIVSGGRGVGGPEGFELLGEIADLLGGSLGASRPAVEAGWAPYERQIGQTGRTVKPKLYIACGISGATQHLAGMRDADTIIAINNDPSAPILDLATLAVEADLHAVLSALAQRLRSRCKDVA